MIEKILYKFHGNDRSPNRIRVRVCVNWETIRFKSFQVSKRSEASRYVKSIAKFKTIHILYSQEIDKKFNLELKRGYYDYEKAKKYFP